MSAKSKSAFFCQNCGTQSPKWIGKCPSCGEWNTFVEEVIERPARNAGTKLHGVASVPRRVEELTKSSLPRIELCDNELNRVLGGGLVPGSLLLFGGEPGIGKSTLMLQVAARQKGITTLYVTGEESEEQISMRAERLGALSGTCMVVMESSLEAVFSHINELNPALLIIDSIQTLYTSTIDSSPGSISQVRECATQLLRYAKENQVPVFLIGHITKDGTLAGPKVLEHMVDTVLHFEGDRQNIYRLLRATKNRFGSTSELGIYEMSGAGLREVLNPSEVLIQVHDSSLSGSAIGVAMEGMRPMLVEVQALVSSAVYGTPQRSTTGLDLRRLNMLLAVLEKRCGFKLGMKDVFLNMAGGFRIEDPALDLAVVAAILSSNDDLSISREICFAGEVGLNGEIRPVARVEQCINEAAKLGFKQICISKYNRGLREFKDIECVPLTTLEGLVHHLFG